MARRTVEELRKRDQSIRALKMAQVHRSMMRILGTKTHRNKFGVPLNFHDFYFMAPIYKSLAPTIVMMSSVQTGKTEYLIAFEIACAMNGLSVLHTLPSYPSRNNFVAERIDPLLEDTPDYAALLRKAEAGKGADNKSMKLFADGVLRFAGSNVRTDFKEFAADVLLADEIDEFNMNNFKLAPDRLEASLFKFTRYAGNPTIPNYGIHTLYQGGTQCEMHWLCEGCGSRRKLDFFKCVCEIVTGGGATDYRLRDNVEREDRFVCHKCGGYLTQEDWRWHPYNEDAPYPSYHISKMLKRRTSPMGMWRAFCKARGDGDTAVQVFYNSDLGLPYAQEGMSVTEDLIRTASLLKVMPEAVKKGWTTMGVDVGKFFDVRISKPVERVRACMHVGRYKTVDELLELVKRYRVRCAVIDAMPETRKAKEFQTLAEEHGCDVWLCRFATTGEGSGTRIVKDAKEREFKVDRTYALDLAVADLREQRNLLPIGAVGLLGGFYADSMTANKRILEKDNQGNVRYKWTKESNDHQRMADVYDLMALLVIGAPGAAGDAQDPEGVQGGLPLQRGVRSQGMDRKFMSSEGEDPIVPEGEGSEYLEAAAIDQGTEILRRMF